VNSTWTEVGPCDSLKIPETDMRDEQTLWLFSVYRGLYYRGSHSDLSADGEGIVLLSYVGDFKNHY